MHLDLPDSLPFPKSRNRAGAYFIEWVHGLQRQVLSDSNFAGGIQFAWENLIYYLLIPLWFMNSQMRPIQV